ncbi:MAG: FKBP-type peptidyl-prolyl cis-trans isomerase, partial [Rhizomicrobium sp.]
MRCFTLGAASVAVLFATSLGPARAADSPAAVAADTSAALSADANANYLADNAKKPGVVTLPGLQYEVLKKGTGAVAHRHDCVLVNYKGWLIDGKVFDQTDGKPVTFPAHLLIPGWTTALQLMHEGDLWRITVPSELAYGSDGTGEGTIPPNQTLVFDVELLKVTKP